MSGEALELVVIFCVLSADLISNGLGGNSLLLDSCFEV